jgi:peptidoglycan/xylan/chitin deacetylase (PgdA/CDA1 family)
MLLIKTIFTLSLLSIISAPNSNKKKAILSFDDGVHKKYTPLILDTLKKYNVKAAFFIMGCMVRWDKKTHKILRRIKKEGHIIGNHTYSHKDIRKLTRRQFVRELQRTENIIKKVTGSRTHIFRPPSGFLPKWAYGILKRRKYQIIAFWDVYGDLESRSHITISKTIIKRVLTSKKKRAIVLLHDTLFRTVKALPIIIRGLKSKGVMFTNFKLRKVK